MERAPLGEQRGLVCVAAGRMAASVVPGFSKPLSPPLELITVRDGDLLVAAVPLRECGSRLTTDCYLQSPNLGAHCVDVIIRRGYEHEGLKALAAVVLAQPRVVLSPLRPSSLASVLGEYVVREGGAATACVVTTHHVVDFRGQTWESYLASLGPKHRANIRHRLRGLTRQFDVSFDRVTSHAARQEALAALATFHEWRFPGGGNSFGDQRSRAFHDAVTEEALDQGWLRLYALRLNGQIAGVLYGYLLDGRWFSYQHGYAEEFKSYGLGVALMALGIRAAIEAGAVEFDLGGGDATGYKQLWARGERWSLLRLDLSPRRHGANHHDDEAVKRYWRGWHDTAVADGGRRDAR